MSRFPPAPKWFLAVAALPLLAPAAFIPGAALFPFVGPRVFLLLAAGVLAASALIPLVASGAARPRRTILGALLALLAVSHVASSFAGLDLPRSLWGTPERMHSLPLLFAGLAWFASVSWTVRRREDWRVLLRVAAATGAVIAVVAGLELAGVVTLTLRWPDRASSLLGNPVFLGAHGLWTVFCGSLLAAWERRRFGRTLAAGAVVLGALSVIASGSRGPALALLAGSGVAALAAVEGLRGQPDRRRRAVVAVALLVVVPSGIWALRDAPGLRSLPVLTRSTDEAMESGSAEVRRVTWGIAWRTAKARPWLGVGPNNYAHAYNFYYQPEIAAVSERISADDAHNAPLQAAAERGIPGAIVTLLLLMMPAGLAVRGLESGRLGLPAAAAVLGFTVAHFIHLLFAFDEVNGQATWLALLALIDALDERGGDADPVRPVGRGAALGGGIVAIIGLVVVLGPEIATERRLVHAQVAIVRNAPEAGATFAATAEAPHPRRHLARLHIARYAIQSAATREGDRTGLIEESLRVAAEVHERHPRDIRPALVYADAVRMAVPEGAYDDPLLADAESLCVAALEWSPQRQDLLFAMARVLLEAGRFEEAEDVASEALATSPKVPWVVFHHDQIERLAEAGAEAEENPADDD